MISSLRAALLACFLCLVGLACDSAPPKGGPDPVQPAPAAGNDAKRHGSADPNAGKKADGDTVVADAVEVPPGKTELKLDGIEFLVPAGWKKVEPANRIIEAEFELPRAEGDEFDGRLTLMSSGGSADDAVAMRSAEFSRGDGDEPPHTDTLQVAGVEARWVDLRGTWKGLSTSNKPIEPRKDYRMLLVIIPFTERAAFYAKLTGPRETIAAREEEFREFIKTAKITIKLPDAK